MPRGEAIVRSSSLLTCVLNHRRQSVELGITQCRIALEKRRDRVGRRTVEERPYDVLERGPTRAFAIHNRQEYVSRAVLLVSHMPLFLEQTEQRANGGV